MFNGLQWGGLLSTLFVLVGMVLLVVAFYQHKQARKLQTVLSELYRLNDQSYHDALQIIPQAWEILQKNNFESFSVQLDWYGEQFEQEYGLKASKKYLIEIDEDNVSGQIILTTQRLFSEQRLMAEMIVQTVRMILTSNISAQIKQVLTSQKRLEDYQLFVQHDTKNIAQFIGLLDSLVANCETQQAKVKLVDRLKLMLPSLVYRAQRMTAPLSLNEKEIADEQSIDLANAIIEMAQAIELKIEVTGNAKVMLSKSLLDIIMHNLLDNFKKHLQEAFVKVEIKEEAEFVVLKLIQEGHLLQQGQDDLKVYRMFQPFWTTSQSGLGLGLFITRATLKKIEGSIEFISNESAQGFLIKMPKKN